MDLRILSLAVFAGAIAAGLLSACDPAQIATAKPTVNAPITTEESSASGPKLKVLKVESEFYQPSPDIYFAEERVPAEGITAENVVSFQAIFIYDAPGVKDLHTNLSNQNCDVSLYLQPATSEVVLRILCINGQASEDFIAFLSTDFEQKVRFTVIYTKE